MSASLPIYGSNRLGTYDASASSRQRVSSNSSTPFGSQTAESSDFANQLESASAGGSNASVFPLSVFFGGNVLAQSQSTALDDGSKSDGVCLTESQTAESKAAAEESDSGTGSSSQCAATQVNSAVTSAIYTAFEHQFVDPAQSSLGGDPVQAMKDVMAGTDVNPEDFTFEYGEGAVQYSWGTTNFYTLRISKGGQVVAEYDAAQVLNAPVTATVALKSAVQRLGISA